MTVIDFIDAQEILDSRGNPTVEVEVVLETARSGRAAVPSGRLDRRPRGGRAARRRQGALRRQGRPDGRRPTSSRSSAPALLGEDASRPGAHRRPAARPRRHAEQGQARRQRAARRLARVRARGGRDVRPAAVPLPRRRRRAHAAGADAQHPQRRQARRWTRPTSRSSWSCPSASTRFSEALRAGAEVFHALRAELHDRGLATGQGDEGGFAPVAAVQRRPPSRPCCGPSSAPATGPASRSPSRSTRRRPSWSVGGAGRRRRADLPAGQGGPQPQDAEMVDLWADWAARYPIVSIEDGLAEDDWQGWQLLTERIGGTVPARRRRPVRDQPAAARSAASRSVPRTPSSSSSTRSAR